MPSIMKMINGKNDSPYYLYDIENYVTNAVKTGGKQWVGAYACPADNAFDSMIAIKQLHHKTHGKQGEHFVLSPEPKENCWPNNQTYMNVAQEVVLQYADFQCVYALHLDSKKKHLHFLLNSVSYKDGAKFSQSPSDLNRKKMYINEILEKYGFLPITHKADDLYDTTDQSGGKMALDYLEIDPPLYRESDLIEIGGYNSPYYESEEHMMNNNPNNQLPTTSNHPNTVMIAPPPLMIQPEVNIHVRGMYDMNELHEECNYQLRESAQLGMEMFQHLRETGYNEPTCIRPTLNLYFDSSKGTQTENNVIETTFADTE